MEVELWEVEVELMEVELDVDEVDIELEVELILVDEVDVVVTAA